MNTCRTRLLKALEGRRVSLALADGSRIEEPAPIARGRGAGFPSSPWAYPVAS